MAQEKKNGRTIEELLDGLLHYPDREPNATLSEVFAHPDCTPKQIIKFLEDARAEYMVHNGARDEYLSEENVVPLLEELWKRTKDFDLFVESIRSYGNVSVLIEDNYYEKLGFFVEAVKKASLTQGLKVVCELLECGYDWQAADSEHAAFGLALLDDILPHKREMEQRHADYAPWRNANVVSLIRLLRASYDHYKYGDWVELSHRVQWFIKEEECELRVSDFLRGCQMLVALLKGKTVSKKSKDEEDE